MSTVIDPQTKPWEEDTEEIWGWMREVWMANVSTVTVPNTQANRINEYRAISQYWEQRYQSNNGHIYSRSVFLDWLQTQYKVNHPDHRGRPPRTLQQRPYDPFF